MNFQDTPPTFLIHLSSEASLKGNKAKLHFTNKLIENLNYTFNYWNLKASIEKTHNGFFLFISHDQIKKSEEILRSTFGISNFSKILNSSAVDIESIFDTGYRTFLPLIQNKSFCVRVKKQGTHAFKSTDLERNLGGKLNQISTSSQVKLKNPDIILNIHVFNNICYFLTGKSKGAGGLPLGTDERALCLMSGGFDSTVAAWKILKRGVPVDFLFFNMGGKASEYEVLEISKKLSQNWALPAQCQMYQIDFSPIIQELKEKVDDTYRQVILKRVFYNLADKFSFKKYYSAIITGESIGQVSSQTLVNLNHIQANTKTQVLRPLIGYDKTEIIDEARKMGVADLCEKVKEYCSISKGQPVIKSKISRIYEQEKRLNEEEYLKCLNDLNAVDLNTFTLSSQEAEELFLESVPEKATILDFQSKDDFDKWHLSSSKNITPTEFQKSYKDWDKSKTYFLYCTHGTQTPFFTELLRDEGFEAYCYKGDIQKLKVTVPFSLHTMSKIK